MRAWLWYPTILTFLVLISSGSPARATCQLSQGLADNIEEVEDAEKRQEECDSELKKAEQAEEHLSDLIRRVGSRPRLIAPISNALAEAAGIRAEGLALVEAIKDPQDVLAAGFDDHHRANWLTQQNLVSRLAALRIEWDTRCRFPDASLAWQMRELLDDKDLSEESLSALRGFVDSFPPWYWGEERAPTGVLDASQAVVDLANRRLSGITYRITRAKLGEVLPKIATQFDEATDRVAGHRHASEVLDRVKWVSYRWIAPAQTAVGVVVTTRTEAILVRDRLKFAIEGAPKHLRSRISEELSAPLDELGGILASISTKRFDEEYSTLLKDTAEMAKSIGEPCRLRTPTIERVIYRAQSRLRSLVEAGATTSGEVPSSDVANLKQLFLERAWLDFNTVQSMCR